MFDETYILQVAQKPQEVFQILKSHINTEKENAYNSIVEAWEIATDPAYREGGRGYWRFYKDHYHQYKWYHGHVEADQFKLIKFFNNDYLFQSGKFEKVRRPAMPRELGYNVKGYGRILPAGKNSVIELKMKIPFLYKMFLLLFQLFPILILLYTLFEHYINWYSSGLIFAIGFLMVFAGLFYMYFVRQVFIDRKVMKQDLAEWFARTEKQPELANE